MSQQREIGTLVVVVLKAQHLHQPSFYKQDPYAQVSFSGLKKRTKVDPKGGQHPVWDDELRFPVLADTGKDRLNRILEVSCYKDEQREEDVFLGKGSVDIEETLKTGEFDDWVPLETSTGARGQVYLEMTFYANSPPPLTRRPSKLNPSDRITRPAAYFTQGRQSNQTSNSQPGHSLASVPEERKPRQLPKTGVSRIPSSLIPARNSQSQSSRQVPSNEGVTSAVKHKNDILPPLPARDDTPDVDFGKGVTLPTSLHFGIHSSPWPTPLQNRNQATSIGRPSLEMLPEQLHKRTLSDTLSDAAALTPPIPFSQLQAPLQVHSSEATSMAKVGSAPSTVVEQYVDDRPLGLSAPLTSPQGLAHEHEPRSIYVAGDSDSFNYPPPGQAHAQPNTQGYIPAPTQVYPRTFSPSQHPMPFQSPTMPSGQLQQLSDVSPITTSAPSFYQNYAQYPGGPSTSQPLSPPQMYSQLHSPQSQVLYPPQPQGHSAFHQQSLPQHLPPPQQQHPQHFLYPQTSHSPDVLQPCQQHRHLGVSTSCQLPVAIQQQPYSQTQPYLTVPPPPPPPPPPAQSQTPKPYVPQTPYQSHFSTPPPPPMYGQGKNGTSVPVFVTQPLKAPQPLSAPVPTPPPAPVLQHVSAVTTLLQPLTAAPLPSQEVPNNISVSSAEAGTVLQEEVRGALKDVAGVANEERNQKVMQEESEQPERLLDTKRQVVREDSKGRQQMEEDRQRHEELRIPGELKGQEEQQEVGHRAREEELKKQEQRKREEEEQQKREELERKRREQEELERVEECRRREEENQRREEDSRRKEEEERRNQEEERQKREEELRRQEEQTRREHEEAEHHRKAAEEAANQRRAEEAEAERRWQAELVRIRARAEQEAADAAFARAQMEAEEAERRRQEEEDLALVRQAQEDAEREERLAQEKRQQEEADMEVARREQAHEEELERRRQEERRRRIEEADRELAKRLDMELNLSTEYGGD